MEWLQNQPTGSTKAILLMHFPSLILRVVTGLGST